MIDRPDAVVVGAGFAGAAAATALAERGARVLVLEARPRPGGRACSWIDPRSGETCDNGQHVLAAFYDETLRLLRRLGTTDALAIDPAFHLRLWERGRGRFELRCPVLPAPLHWIAALSRCGRLSLAARAAALGLRGRARALLRANGSEPALTVDAWLAAGDGHPDLAAVVRPIALAALNEDPRDGAASLLARVLDRLLGAPASRSGLALPRGALGDLLRGFDRFLAARGGAIRYRATVLGLRVEGDRCRGVSLLGAGRIETDRVVLAIPHERVGWVLPESRLGSLRAIIAAPWSPIVSATHTYDRPILPGRFVGLLGTRTQWAFDRGPQGSGGHQVGTLRSAAFADVARGATEILAETHEELCEAFPAARDARLLRSRLYKERKATLRSVPEIQRHRPGPETAIRGLYLAGDWTDTGLPPTIEGAVLSGHRAAGLVA